MPSEPQNPGRPAVTPLAKPFLDALHRMQARELLRPDELERRARALLEERFGPGPEPVHVGFAPGCIGLISEHTHFFDGFALLMPLPSGTAVAVRPNGMEQSRIVTEQTATPVPLARGAAAEGEPRTAALGRGVLAGLAERALSKGAHLDVAFASTVSEERPDTYVTALASAFLRACRTASWLRAEEAGAAFDIAGAVEACARRPFSPAYPLALVDPRPDAFQLVDVGTGEHLPLEQAPPEELGWGLVQIGQGCLREAAFYERVRADAEEALGRLRRNGFEEMASFRSLEHRDLQRALDGLPEPLAPLVRYLVGENRRVQKLAAAVRRKDWQLLGALLLMSHAAKRNDLGLSCPEADFAVELAEAMSIDGMYGATLTGWGGTVVVTGRPFTVPEALDRIQEQVRARFGFAPEVMLL